MGCLSVNTIGFAYDIAVSATNLNTSIEIITTAFPTQISVQTTNYNSSVEVTSEYSETDVAITYSNKNITVSFQIGLICEVGLDDYLYLQVNEGNIILIDNNYIKVLRE